MYTLTLPKAEVLSEACTLSTELFVSCIIDSAALTMHVITPISHSVATFLIERLWSPSQIYAPLPLIVLLPILSLVHRAYSCTALS